MERTTSEDIIDTADGSNGVTVNCVNVRASGINSLDQRRRKVICRVTYTQHVTIWCYRSGIGLTHVTVAITIGAIGEQITL
jgi:hypothetical protein